MFCVDLCFNCVVLRLIVLFYVIFVCKCVSTQLQLTNISYIISYATHNPDMVTPIRQTSVEDEIIGIGVHKFTENLGVTSKF